MSHVKQGLQVLHGWIGLAGFLLVASAGYVLCWVFFRKRPTDWEHEDPD